MRTALPMSTHPARFTEEWDASQRGSSIIEAQTMQRSHSLSASTTSAVTGDGSTLSRGNTLKKRSSTRRSGSLRRSNSHRSMRAGSVKSLALQLNTNQDEIHSAFSCPVPTAGNPTEILAARFQAWRKILKDLINYFREIQSHYEHRSKSLLKLSNVLNNTSPPPGFLASGGLDDALQIMGNHNRQAITDASKAREIEEDVILALTGLRSDLQLKIKEIKNLSADFKNSVEKEMEATRKTVNNLQDTLGQTELDPSLTTGKQDPYLLRLAVDRQLERQIEEENYLHQAYLNLENSGRELESIVVGEIQKAYNAYAGILKREADALYGVIDHLRNGPVSMPRDREWTWFIQRSDQFIAPDLPMRSAEYIHYPGRDHPACQEIRAGLLERKGKYLKSYSAGWYVLSPTHLHEFKSADKTQAPVVSLYLPLQTLGSHSVDGSSSNKFILKGRQTGSIHRGHTWVFRAESYDTMMAWYEDIKALTEQSPEERSNFVRGHVRSQSQSSQQSLSSDGVVDEEDDEPFAAKESVSQPRLFQARPSPGGRFPSDLEVNAQRGLQVPHSPLSVSSVNPENTDHDVIAAAGVLPGSAIEEYQEHTASHGTHSAVSKTAGSKEQHSITRQSETGHEVPYMREVNRPKNPYEIAIGPDLLGQQAGDFVQPGVTTEQQHNPLPEVTALQNPTDSSTEAGKRVGVQRLQMCDDDPRTRQNTFDGLNTTSLQQKPSPALWNNSVPMISNLHIPGEFPKGTSAL